MEAALRVEYEKLDPVELLRQIEHHQNLLWPYAYKPPDWAQQGGTTRAAGDAVVKTEEVKREQPSVSRREIGDQENREYRRTGKPTRHSEVEHTSRTRPDPFVLVWGRVEAMLEENPSLQVKAIFQQLQREYPGQ